jgi:hypothetical protein
LTSQNDIDNFRHLALLELLRRTGAGLENMREQLREPQATEAARRLCVTHNRHWAVGIRPAFVMSGQGGGSFTADGTMIDIPVIDRAHRLQARRDRALVQEGLAVC